MEDLETYRKRIGTFANRHGSSFIHTLSPSCEKLAGVLVYMLSFLCLAGLITQSLMNDPSIETNPGPRYTREELPVYNKIKSNIEEITRISSTRFFFLSCLDLQLTPKCLKHDLALHIARPTEDVRTSLLTAQKSNTNHSMEILIKHYDEVIPILLATKKSLIQELKGVCVDHNRYEYIMQHVESYYTHMMNTRQHLKLKKINTLLSIQESSSPLLNKWITELNLTCVEKRYITDNEEICDAIANATTSLLMRLNPLLHIQSTTLNHEFLTYSPSETLHIHHNGQNHYVLSSSIGNKIQIYDSLNSAPSKELLLQLQALYSPDDATPEISQVIMPAEQTGGKDCGLFSIAYATDLALGQNPANFVYDQSVMRDHLLCCLESREMLPFPKLATHSQTRDSVDVTSNTPEEHKWQNPKRPGKPFQNNNKRDPISTNNRYDTLEQIDPLHNVTPVFGTSNPNLHHASSTEPSPPPTVPSQDHQNNTEDTLEPTTNTETPVHGTPNPNLHYASSTEPSPPPTKPSQDNQNKAFEDTEATTNTETLHDYVTIINNSHTSTSTTSFCQDQHNEDHQETSTPNTKDAEIHHQADDQSSPLSPCSSKSPPSNVIPMHKGSQSAPSKVFTTQKVSAKVKPKVKNKHTNINNTTKCNKSKQSDHLYTDETPPTFTSQKNINSKSNVVNISSRKLTQEEVQVLELGLNFCPSVKHFNKEQLADDFYWFIRRLKLREYFHEESNSNTPTPTPHADQCDLKWKQTNPNWYPEKVRNHRSPALVEFIDNILKDTSSSLKSHESKYWNNLDNKKRAALVSLANDTSIVIKPSDKCGSIVVMNREDYEKECLSHLTNTEFYEELPSDPNEDYREAVADEVNSLYENNSITDFQRNTILQGSQTPTFYGLPKLHNVYKRFPSLRGISSGHSSCTAKLSEYIDSYLKCAAQKTSTYVKDTTHFINRISKICFPSSSDSPTFLVTMDVNSLYPNIDQREGAEACEYFLNQRKTQSLSSSTIKSLIMLVLRSHTMCFLGRFFHQIKGTAMGTSMAVNFSNLFMAKFEQDLLTAYQTQHQTAPALWIRYIDDVFVIWKGSEESLKHFLTFCNQYSKKKHVLYHHIQIQLFL